MKKENPEEKYEKLKAEIDELWNLASYEAPHDFKRGVDKAEKHLKEFIKNLEENQKDAENAKKRRNTTC